MNRDVKRADGEWREVTRDEERGWERPKGTVGTGR